MAEKLKPAPKKISKKQARLEIYKKLSVVLESYKNGADSKKFDRKLKKASKLFAPYIAKQGSVETK